MEHRKIRIRAGLTVERLVTVDALVFEQLALYPIKEGWSVTHVESGYVISEFEVKHVALNFLISVQELVDFDWLYREMTDNPQNPVIVEIIEYLRKRRSHKTYIPNERVTVSYAARQGIA